MRILLVGYTYTRENLFEVFESYPERENLYFILPLNWKEKGGKVRYKNFKKPGFHIYRSPALFFHSNYPLIGGLFKGWMPLSTLLIIWLRITKKIDVLYTTGEPNLLGTLCNAVLARVLGLKHIFNFWENIPYEKKDRGLKLTLKKLIVKLNIVLSDGALCGMTKAEEILRTFSRDIIIGRFLHAGFNEDRFRPDLEPRLRKSLGLENKFVFLFVGALGYRKGIHLALESLADLKKEFDNLYFLIIGSGEFEESLKARVKNLGLDSLVKFIPWMDNRDLPEVLCSADVFLYPSIPHEGWEEQFGYSIAEASLCGLPVISTKSGGIDEVLIDGKTGIMVEPNSIPELKNAMRKLIVDNSFGKELGRNGRQFVTENYSNRIIAKKIYGLFKEVYGSK